MSDLKNLNFTELKNENCFELKWEFNINLKKICIQCFYFLSTKLYKILYNEKVIQEKINIDNCNSIKFIEDDHYYEIILDTKNSKLFIDRKSFDDLYKRSEEINEELKKNEVKLMEIKLEKDLCDNYRKEKKGELELEKYLNKKKERLDRGIKKGINRIKEELLEENYAN